jgi:glycosyltransferase involved in cell wall biosynthesis
MEALKRQSLAIEAMRHVSTPVRLVLAGRGPDERSLRELAASRRVADRVTFEIGVPDERLLELYEGALAVYFGPFDEDYGYVTIEGFSARRPVVTLSDSGGPLEFVTDGGSGLVAAPEPEAIAAAFDRLFTDRDAARAMGEVGFETVRERVPDWPEILDRLLA